MDQPLRYQETQCVSSALSVMDDVLTFVRFLLSRDYTIGLLKERHRLTNAEAKERTKAIIPHVRIAVEYVEQSLGGPASIAFLPAYYAILNMLKCYVLTGPHHAKLKTQRWHGASYDVNKKDSRSLLTENILLHPNGAIPLFCQTVTGSAIRHKTSVTMANIYPYVTDVSAELMLLGIVPQVGTLIYDVAPGGDSGSRFYVRVIAKPLPKVTSTKALKGFRRRSATNEFMGPYFDRSKKRTQLECARDHTRTFLLYHPVPTSDPDDTAPQAPLGRSHLLLPEELPIALLFFHLSNVVRYKPELLERIGQTSFWPVAEAARRHALLKFLVLFWSHMHQKTLLITSY